MARCRFCTCLMMAVCIVTTWVRLAVGADPEATTDFVLPAGMDASDVDGSFFTFEGFRGGANASAGTLIKPVKAFQEQFAALTGLGISAAFLEFPPSSLNPPHTHPRATELLFVIDGTLMVGLVDTSKRMYNQTLQKGDLFVFPKGLVHFQMNPASYGPSARALASFSSANPGTNSLPGILFGSGIPSSLLAQAFQVSSSTVSMLESPFRK